jgi:glycine hydroxymethyltransferase
VDFKEVLDLAKEHKPKMIICGGSAYPRYIEFETFREIADKTGAFLMADIAHPAGLIASDLHPSPIPFCDVITTTTHKTLRGPRGGMIMMGKDRENPWGKVAPKSGRIKNISELIDSMVMPGIQGGPLMHIISAKAVAFGEALDPSFKRYSSQIVQNAKCIAEEMMKRNYDVISGGTDTHLVLIDLTKKDVSGRKAEQSLEKAGITVNKNMVPFDKRSPLVTSGIRIGTSAITTRGMQTDQMKIIAEMIDLIVKNYDDEKKIKTVRGKVRELSNDFPLYQELFTS